MEKFEVETKGILEKIREQVRKKIILYSSIFALNTISLVVRIEDFLRVDKEEFLEYVKDNSNVEDTEFMENKIDYLYKEFGEISLTHFFNRITEESKKDLSGNLKVCGFEAEGLDNKLFHNLWSEEYYPKGTINKQLEKVVFEKTPEKSGYTNKENVASVNSLKDDDIITFHASKYNHKYDSKIDQAESADWVFSHEIGHINDWGGKNNLDVGEKVKFLYEVSKSFSSKNSFRDLLGYINEISKEDKKIEKYLKVSEYWAVLCEYFLTFPELFNKRASSEEKELINKWFLSGDRGFNNLEKYKQRREYIKNTLNSR